MADMRQQPGECAWLRRPGKGNYKYAAFRAHYFQVVPAMEATNVLECHILRVIEDTFSTVVLFCNGNRTGEQRQRC